MAGLLPDHEHTFFCDETGISGDRFLVVGGLVARKTLLPKLYATMDTYRDRHNMKSELKWSKVSDQKLAEYKALIDFFFAMNNRNLLHFHCVIFDNHKSAHRKYNDGDKDKGLSKLYYQLILHKFCKTHGSNGSCFVCLDRRNSSTPLEDLRRMINAAAARDCQVFGNPVKELVSADSKKEDMLQLNDVILGAVGAARNGKHLVAGYRAAKRELAELVVEKSGLDRFDINSPRSVRRFTVWNFNPGPR